MKKTLLALSLCMMATPMTIQGAQARPVIKNLRYEENWIKTPQATENPDLWDNLKYIPFNESGDIYLSLGGSWRIRGEGWTGYDFKPDQNAIFGLNQVRFHSDFHATDFFRLYLEGLSALGSPRNLPGGIPNNTPTGLRSIDLDSLDLQNAFVDLKYSWAPDQYILLRPGRQEMDFGKQRLISSLVWVNTRRTFDAISLIGQFAGWNLRGVYAQYVKAQPWSFNLSGPDSSFYGLYATGPVGIENFSSDLYWLGLHKDKTSFQAIEGREDRHTLGARLNGKFADGFDLDAEAAYQLGTFANQNIQAGFGAFDLGYSFNLPWTPRLGLGLDYASGDTSSSDSTLNTFNQLFPLGHAYYGYADQLGRQNAIGTKATLSAKPLPELTLALDNHLFWRASAQDDVYGVAGNVTRKANSGSDTYLGYEADLTATWKWDAHLQTQLGFSLFAPGSFYQQGGTSALQSFTYLQGQYSF